MLRCFYTAGTGMLVQRDKMDVLTNNLINADTVGYKSDFLVSESFNEMLIRRLNDPYGGSSIVGELGTGAHIGNVVTSFKQGNLEYTGRECDLALEGQGFFVVAATQGERYTRDGSFSVSDAGYLVNSDGYYVKGVGERIYVGDGEVTIDELGNVYVEDVFADRIRIVSFEDTAGLRKDENNLYASAGQRAGEDSETKVRQGYLESSNVEISGELADMLMISRAYETNQRVLRMVDGTLDKAVNEVGRI